MSAGDRAPVGLDLGDPARFQTDAGDRVAVEEASAALRGPPCHQLDDPDGLGQPVGGRVQAAQDRVAGEERREAHALVGVDEPALDTPGREPAVAAAQVHQALRVSAPARCCRRSGSTTHRRVSRPLNFSTVYVANLVIVRLGLAWNTSPGACEVEPPAAGRRPWSTTVMSVQPRSVSSSARPTPTMPAPMMTTRGDRAIRLPLPLRSRPMVAQGIRPSAWRWQARSAAAPRVRARRRRRSGDGALGRPDPGAGDLRWTRRQRSPARRPDPRVPTRPPRRSARSYACL